MLRQTLASTAALARMELKAEGPGDLPIAEANLGETGGERADFSEVTRSFSVGSRAFTWHIAAPRSPKDSLPVPHLSPPLRRPIAGHSCFALVIVFGVY